MCGVSYGIQLLGFVYTLWTMEKIGRKRMLVYDSSIMFISLITTTALASELFPDWSSERDAECICLGFLFLYMLVFGASWGPVTLAMPFEIFPNYL
jgi:hypothetical protein